MRREGVFITFEGIDGCGKSTQAKLLCEFLKSQGHRCILVREPGGTSVGEKIREILLSKDSHLNPEAELFLFLASRSLLTQNVIIPKLKEGAVVIADRYMDSSVAYQGFGRGVDLDFVKEGNFVATKGTFPDLTYYIDISVEEALRRKKKRDRMEEDVEFLKRVREGYKKISEETDRIVFVDGERSIEEVWEDVRREFLNRIGRDRF